MPALLTSTSRPPSAPRTSSKTRSTSAATDASAMLPVMPGASVARRSSALRSMSQTCTRAPASLERARDRRADAAAAGGDEDAQAGRPGGANREGTCGTSRPAAPVSPAPRAKPNVIGAHPHGTISVSRSDAHRDDDETRRSTSRAASRACATWSTCCTRARRPRSSRAASPTSTRCRRAIRASRRWSRRVRMAMAVRNRLELQQQRERGMLAVIESAQDLSSRLDLQELLSAIVSRARNLLGSDLAWLSTYDADAGEFHVLVADGALSQRTSAMVARRDRGVAGIVMSTRLPFTTPDYLHDKRFAHDAELDDTFRDEGIAALVGVPLIWEGEVIGLLFVADRYHRTHTAQSISILCTLATHGAVALKNARDFERVNAALAKADQARAELERHLRSIQAATDAHEQMTSLLARGASLATLCQTVAQLLGGSVLVLDEAAPVISRGTAPGYDGAPARSATRRTASTAPTSRAPLRPSRADGPLGRRLRGRRRDLPRDARDRRRRRARLGAAVPSRRARRSRRCAPSSAAPASSASCCCRSSAPRRRSNRSAVGAAALARLAAPGRSGRARRPRRAARPRPGPAARAAAGRDGRPARRLRGAALRRHRAAGERARRRDRRRARRPVRRERRARRAPGASRPGCARSCSAVHRGVLSRPVARPAEIPALYATLRRALAVLGRLGVQGQIVGQNELALYSTLFETHDRTSLDNFLEATIGPLLAHDREARLRPGGHAAALLRLQPERQDDGAAPGHPRQHRAPAAGHDRGPARPLGPCVARARDPHRAAPVEPRARREPRPDGDSPRCGFSRWQRDHIGRAPAMCVARH